MTRYRALKWLPLLILLAGFSPGAAIATDENRIPLTPLTSIFQHWDHHWFVWLPRHPVYESVEVASQDTPGSPFRLVWVFFTERAGEKRQHHYLDNQNVVSRWPESVYRPIRYVRSGVAGGPQGLTLSFDDKDARPVEIDIAVDARPLKEAGLTDQIGHAVRDHFLVFYREKSATAVRNRVAIGGGDFSFNSDDRIEPRYPFRASYSANVYTVSLPFTTTRFHYVNGRLKSDGGLIFVQTSAPDAGLLHVSGASGGGDNRVALRTTAHGGLAAYTHEARGHTFAIRFDPPLLEWVDAEAPPVTYRMSLDHFADLITGQIYTSRNGAQIVLEWRHARPLWAQSSPFRSTLRMQEDGYQLQVSPLP